MISLSEVGGLYRSIPPNLKDARTVAFAYACDMQIKKLLECAEKVKVWCAVGKVDEKYLDYLAADCRALLYEPSMDSRVKRELIANSQYWHMKLGTTDALKGILQIVFHGNEAAIEEWFEYGGEPFHFRVELKNAEVSLGQNEEFRKMLDMIKRLSAQLDALIYVYSYIFKHSISCKARLNLISEFYPRYNIPPHRLDGVTQLDGSQRLDGRLAGVGSELYPAALRVGWEARATPKAACGLRIVRNYKCLDGTTRLDGTGMLDAEVYEVQL